MSRYNFLFTASILSILSFLLGTIEVDELFANESGNGSNSQQLPNVIIVLADDLGYGDLGCYGSQETYTPNLDRFASESVRLTDCYSAAPNCSPARAGLMTGRTPYRVGIYNWIPFLSPMHLQESEVTLATLLRDQGFETCHVGKWHLNGWFNLPGQPQPDDHGFDHWFSTQNNALPNHRDPYNFVRNDIPVGPLEGFAADIVIDEAIDWLSERENSSRPFFLFVCFHEPHEPIASSDEFLLLYDYADTDPARAAYHANVTQMDHSFGRLIDYVDRQSYSDETIVFFTSDNGPARTNIHPHGSSGGLREKKGHLYEGGIRVPGLFRWPGHHSPGEVVEEPVSGLDVLPTLCDILQIDLPSDRTIDGTSLLPLIEGSEFVRENPLYWQFAWAHSEPKVAIRLGDWKLVANLDSLPPRSINITADTRLALEQGRPSDFELYNLRLDQEEQVNRAEEQPQVLSRMIEQMNRLFDDVRSDRPQWPDWEFPRYEGERIEWPDYRGKRNRDDPQSTARPWR